MDRVSQATQTARAWLNQCSELSQSGRHEEARAVALQVQQNIANVLIPEAQSLTSDGDMRGLDAVKELRVLQCASLLARALDAQAPEDSASWSGASLYLEAKELAESFLPPIHPMVALTRSLYDDRAVSASAPVTLPSLSPKGGRQSPSGSRERTASSSSSTVAALPEPKLDVQAPAPKRMTTPSPREKDKNGVQPMQRMPSHRSQTSDSQQEGEGGEYHDDDDDHEYEHDDEHAPRVPKNIFAEYLADYRLEKEMTKPWFNNRQDELRKHVFEQARFVRLQNQGKNVKELSDPKFTSCGHKIQVKVLHKINQSRSEPALMQQVKMAGNASPEAFLTCKIRQQLDPKAKPMTQPKRKKRFLQDS